MTQKYCSSCGSSIEEGAQICPYCGKKEEIKAEKEKPLQEKSKLTNKDKLLLFVILMAITLILSGAILIIFGY